MKSSQLALIVVALLVAILLFTFGNTKTPMETALANSGMPTGASSSKKVDPEVLEELWKARLGSEQRDSLINLKKNLANLKKDERAAMLGNISEQWEKWRNWEASAYYGGEEAKIDGSISKYISSGERIFAASRFARADSIAGPFLLDYGIELVQNGVEAHPQDDDLKILLSRFLVDGKGAVMQGVSLLRQVTDKDSTHLEANLILAKLGLQSGQFDKAAARMERVLSKVNNNAEAWYYLGEAQVGLQNKVKATEAFEQCLKYSEDLGFKRELELYIKEINK